LADALTMAGLEVETIEYIGKSWGNKIITAQITHLEKVEGSDHLNYTRINTRQPVDPRPGGTWPRVWHQRLHCDRPYRAQQRVRVGVSVASSVPA